MPWTLGAEEYQGLSSIPREVGVPNMRVFRGSAILLTVTLVSVGIFILYDSMTRRTAAGSDSVIAGAALFSLALTWPYFLPRPTVK